MEEGRSVAEADRSPPPCAWRVKRPCFLTAFQYSFPTAPPNPRQACRHAGVGSPLITGTAHGAGGRFGRAGSFRHANFCPR